ncbi:Homocysteine S-methyltransferase [Roseovarius albus]|uniref:Homocysteine S-methyltransferase n=1 Tax=Roseovarius albus TaxID=1247867 RepID=A0A1X7A4I4_9RHOB|nr:homocysteine S-methyltransferase family protein [Roseovarius albus]SLN70018.1 Homocysteine S-methyltransferase [Roseovarius albus]
MVINNFPVILGEGSMYERLRRGGSSAFDPEIAHAGMLYDEIGRKVLRDTHREYLDIGQKYQIPMACGTPTWRAGDARVKKSAHAGISVNADAVLFMVKLRDSYGPSASPIVISGVTGPYGDGYLPNEAPDIDAARELHKPQINELAEAGVDFLKALTLPSFAEARGIAQVMQTTGLPYVLSFVIRPDGCILDGTPLDLAIDTIDQETHWSPMHYAVNCVHASVFSAVCTAIRDSNPTAAERLQGIDANTSAKTPEELNGLTEIDTEAPDQFGRNIAALLENFGITHLGGCCGSSTEHIAALARRISQKEIANI